MNKTQLIDVVASKTGLKKKEAEAKAEEIEKAEAKKPASTAKKTTKK